MTKFNKGDYVEILSSPYLSLGPLAGERGKISSVARHGYEVKSDILKDDRYPSQTWPFFEEELKLVGEDE